MDSNNMYQNQQSGQNPDYNQGDNSQNTYTNVNSNPNVNSGYQQMYQPVQTNLEEPVTMGDWVVTMLIMMVPCVNIVMMFVWAFSSGTKKSKSNYFKAALIFVAICIVLSFVFGVAIANMIQNMLFYYR